ncbi:cyclase family protein [Amycolatopsis sp. NPDC005232]|uniref:cyclase family protein n=1 Tax=Amycolatopsis sp. NPDC005232 TaxID=3157027 RepID=UPI0033AE61A6
MTGWGRWGADDERGATNLLDAPNVLSAVTEVRTGEVVRLAAPIRGGHGFGLVGRPDPLHLMVRDGGDYAAGLPERGGFGFADDILTVPTHGVSHVDALSHVWQDGLLYNGFPSSYVTSQGARKLGIEKIPPVVTRGVFVDAAASRPRTPDDPVHVEELQALLAANGVELRTGDALLVRTGWLASGLGASTWGGLHSDCAAWLAGRDVVLVGADNPGVEVFPSGVDDCQVPLHIELVRGHGILFAELLDLEPLAAAGRATFLFVLAPLPLVGGVGSPVVPVAIL